MKTAQGVGINYRSETADQIKNYLQNLDFIEINTERLFDGQVDHHLSELMQKIPYVFHGLNLSLGTRSAHDPVYLEKLKNLLHRFSPGWYSDHLAFTRVENKEMGQLLPVQSSKENAIFIARKIIELQKISPLPFLIENIAYYFSIPGEDIDEAEFIKTITDLSSCNLLIDINNLYTNSVNFKFDPIEFLEALPLELVREVHVAGFDKHNDILVDSHGHSVHEKVWRLLEFICQKAPVDAIVLERERNFEDFDGIMKEVEIARGIFRKFCK
jgi:uncharacterized protein (UPF0276 family)